MVGLLQWGRNLIVAEGIEGRILEAMWKMLQWGRNLIVAEGEAAPCACAKTVALQWGRNLIVAEGPDPGADAARVRAASMGPQLDSCGRMSPETVREFEKESFNGAAT